MKRIALFLFCLSILCSLSAPAEAKEGDTHGERSLSERIEKLEEVAKQQPNGDNWFDRIGFSGLIEVEAFHEEIDYKNPATTDETGSDVDLAVVELAIDAKIAKHVDGHVLFKYEFNDIFVDEGFIRLTGNQTFPVYLIAGRQYIPFGVYESDFITDPVTLILGETNNGAVVAGCQFADEMVNISIGGFKGRVKKIGNDDVVSNIVGALTITPLKKITLGASYTSNLAASDALSEVVMDPDGDNENDNISSFVGGFSAFFSASVNDRLRLTAEYVGAVDEFKAGELYADTDINARKPAAWSVEFDFTICDVLEAAVRYEGSDDGDAGGGEFLPEHRYGAVLNWRFFEKANLAVEYLHGKFQGDFQKTDAITAQLAVEF